MIADAEVHGDPSNACTITVIVIISIDGSIFTTFTLLSMYYGPLEGPLILTTDHTSYPVSRFSFLEVFVVLQLYYYILPVSVFSFLVIYPDAAVRHSCTTKFISSFPFSLSSSSVLSHLYRHSCSSTFLYCIPFSISSSFARHGRCHLYWHNRSISYGSLRSASSSYRNLQRIDAFESHSYSSKCGTCYVFVRP